MKTLNFFLIFIFAAFIGFSCSSCNKTEVVKPDTTITDPGLDAKQYEELYLKGDLDAKCYAELESHLAWWYHTPEMGYGWQGSNVDLYIWFLAYMTNGLPTASEVTFEWKNWDPQTEKGDMDITYHGVTHTFYWNGHMTWDGDTMPD